MALDSKSAPDSALTVCGDVVARCVQRTVCPTRAVTFSGTKRMSFMSTCDRVAWRPAGRGAPPAALVLLAAAGGEDEQQQGDEEASDGMRGRVTVRTCRATFSRAKSSPPRQLHRLLDRALALKAEPTASRVLEGRTVALLFEQPSTRTRTSMEAGVVELGGHPMVLRANELQLTRGESVRDTALVFSRHAAAIGLRTGNEERLERARRPRDRARGQHALAAAPPVPGARRPDDAARGVRRRSRAGALAYVGDGNNVARSLAILGALAGRRGRVAAPPEFQLPEAHGAQLTDDPAVAVDGADVALHRRLGLDERRRGDAAARREALAPYRLDDALLDRARAAARSPCTACPRTPARRSPRRSSTATASASGTRPRTAATPRRRCWSCSFRRSNNGVGSAADHAAATPVEPQEAAAGSRSRRQRHREATPAGVREQLARFLDPREVVVVTRERLQEALDDAVERGRMTRDDATALLTALFERGRTQTDDLIAQLEAA